LSIHLPDDFSDKDYSVSIDPMTWDTYEGTLADITKEDVSSGPVYRIVHIRKEPYLEIELIPFRASAEENTKWEKLVSFSLNISYEARSASHRLKSNALKYATASKLADGKWVKVGTSKRGMHKIPYSTLSDWGFSEPSKVQVYGNPGAMLPMANNAPRPDDLPAIGCLHKNNALFFFSPATWQWKWDENHELFKHQKHLYSPIAFFFLSQVSSSVKSPGTKDIIEAPETHTTETYDDLYFHEQDTENVLKSGNQWFGEKFNRTLTLEKSFTAAMPNILPGREAVFYTQVLGRANSAHGFEIDIDNTNTNIGIGTISLDNYEGYYGRISTKKELFNPGSTFIDVNYRYTNSATKSIGWIDYFIINATGKLSLTNESLVFRNKATTGTDNITSYHISGSTQNPHVWEITNPLEPVAIKTKILNNKLVFKDTSSSLKEYVAFDTNMSLPVPKFIENTPNQNLHGSQLSEMVIVAPPEFIDQANRLASLHMEPHLSV
jgi:hypothetical protein